MITVSQRKDGDATIFELFDSEIGDVPLSSAIVLADSYLINVSTLSAFRGRGYGKTLMQEVVSQAAELGFDSLYLHVSKANDPAIHIYEAAGFRKTETKHGVIRMEWKK